MSTTQGTGAGTSPLADIRAAVGEGAGTVSDVARRTGLDPDVVRVGLDHLVALRLVAPDPLAGTCGVAAAACGGCPASARCG
jgi:DNA-binding IclR family transcriptional regulator